MDDLLDNEGSVEAGDNFQGIFPEVGFTCSGHIHKWLFGAEWRRSIGSYTELQLWRPVGRDGSYVKVGNTTIIVPGSISSRLYQYPLSPPLAFQAGDVLGYYQPHRDQSQLGLYFEREGKGERQRGYYYYRDGPASELDITRGARSSRQQIFVDVVTDSPECECGFMSLERMQLLRNQIPINSYRVRGGRQQITPEMKFTCDGMITKWIIGASWWSSDYLYPELQIWRNIGNETYQEINATLIEFETQMFNQIYEYDNFIPIPVQSGDILGMFLPSTSDSRLDLYTEYFGSAVNYIVYSPTSPIEVIDIENNMPSVSLRTDTYHPFVSVEIVRDPASSVMIPPTTSLVSTAALTSGPLPTSPAPPPSIGRSQSPVGAGVGAGVAVALVLVALVVVAVIVAVCLLRRRRGGKTVATGQVQRSNGGALDNPVYTAEVSRMPPAVEGSQELYETPQQPGLEDGEGVYDMPPPDSQEPYSEVAQGRDHTSSPGGYAKFDNPLYEQN
jgi:hypothetical protein